MSNKWAASAGARYSADDREIDFLRTLRIVSADVEIARFQEQADRQDDALTPNFVLSYTPMNEVLAYASIGRGYKAGGFDTNNAPGAGFRPESLWAYEIGVKSTLVRSRATFHASAFHYDYDDLQLLTLPPDAPIGTFSTVINAAKATIDGAEGELMWRVGPGWALDFGVSVLDARFKNFRALNPNQPAAGVVDRAGARLPRAPELTLMAGLEGTRRVGQGSVSWRAHAAYQDDMFLDIYQTSLSRVTRIRSWMRKLAIRATTVGASRYGGTI